MRNNSQKFVKNKVQSSWSSYSLYLIWKWLSSQCIVFLLTVPNIQCHYIKEYIIQVSPIMTFKSHLNVILMRNTTNSLLYERFCNFILPSFSIAWLHILTSYTIRVFQRNIGQIYVGTKFAKYEAYKVLYVLLLDQLNYEHFICFMECHSNWPW